MKPAQESVLPPGMSVQEAPGDFRVIRRWRRKETVLLTLFGTVWCAIMSLYYAAALSKPGRVDLLVYSTPLLLGTLALIYSCLAQWLNRTEIRVVGRRLTIRHGPVPWRGGGEWEASAIAQLWCRERKVRLGGRRGEPPTFALRYDLLARMKGDGGDRVLVKDLEQPDQARWLERSLEEVLDLRHEPIAGELSR